MFRDLIYHHAGIHQCTIRNLNAMFGIFGRGTAILTSNEMANSS